MDLKNKLTIIIIGRSGSGKGTQASFVLKRLRKLGVRHLETGRLLRGILSKENNPTAEAGRNLMKKGAIFPYWFASFTWVKEMIERGAVAYHMVFDGAPRKIEEAKLLDDVVEWHGRHLPVAVYVDVGREECARRLMARQRADDNLSAIKHRLDYFETDVIPVIKYYKKNKRLIQVNGEQEVEKVWREIDQKLSKKLGDKWPK